MQDIMITKFKHSCAPIFVVASFTWKKKKNKGMSKTGTLYEQLWSW